MHKFAPQAAAPALTCVPKADAKRTVSSMISAPSLVETRSVVFNADDQFPVAGTLISAKANTGPLVLISSATAVSRGYYMKFALACVNAGARAALIYDYRGVAKSAAPLDWQQRINMKDWGIRDLPAAIRFLDSQAPGHTMVGVGHSVGGTILGLSEHSSRFARYAMVASALGTLALTDQQMSLYLRMNFLGKPIASLLGKAPGWLGTGETLPASVFNDWARWCRQPNYLFDDTDIPETAHFDAVTCNVLSISIDDDPWATQRAVLALEKHFKNARYLRWTVSANDCGGESIGHFGYFRSKYAQVLWPELISWLNGNSEGRDTRAR